MKNLHFISLAAIIFLFSCTQDPIELDKPPTASFTHEKDSLKVTFTSTSSGKIISYTWQFGDGAFNTEDKIAVHTYDSAGTYAVTLTVANNEGNGKDVQEITVP